MMMSQYSGETTVKYSIDIPIDLSNKIRDLNQYNDKQVQTPEMESPNEILLPLCQTITKSNSLKYFHSTVECIAVLIKVSFLL